MLSKLLEIIISNIKIFKFLCNSSRRGYLYEIGWIDSYKTQSPIRNNYQPIPWVTYSFIGFIEPLLNKDMHIFEYGSGNSTLYYADKVNTVTSVEHDKKWYEKLKHNVPDNTKLIYRELQYGGYYSKTIDSIGKNFSIVIVDGRDRVNCILSAIPYLSTDGVLILDDSERKEYKKGIEYLQQSGYRKIDFWGIAPGIFFNKCTSIFYRDKNCLGI
jgi:hypothetical protein